MLNLILQGKLSAQHHPVEGAAQQVAGADLAVENPCGAVLVFAVLQVKFGDTASAARRLSSGPLGGWPKLIQSMMTHSSSMPTVYAGCRSLEHLWQLGQEQAMRTGCAPEDVFGAIGLFFVDPAEYKVFFPTPDNAMVFARTGGDGIHYSLLHVDGKVRDNSPVVMTVPFYAYVPNVVVG